MLTTNRGFGQPLRGLLWLVSAGAGTGLVPVAPATAASAVAVAAYWFLPVGPGSIAHWAMVVAGFPLGVFATSQFSRPEDPDPKSAVWDEVVGVWASCLFVPKEWPWILAAFCLFRVLDVVKPWPARRVERLPGGLGIMSDDLVSGLQAAVLLWLVSLAF